MCVNVCVASAEAIVHPPCQHAPVASIRSNRTSQATKPRSNGNYIRSAERVCSSSPDDQSIPLLLFEWEIPLSTKEPISERGRGRKNVKKSNNFRRVRRLRDENVRGGL